MGEREKMRVAQSMSAALEKSKATAQPPVRLSLEVSAKVNDMIEAMAEATGSTKSEVLRRAIALMRYAVDAAASGKVIGIADSKGGKLETVIVGPGF